MSAADEPHKLLCALLQAYMRTGLISGVDMRRALGVDAARVAVFPVSPARSVRSGGEDMGKIESGGDRGGGGVVIRPISFFLRRIAVESAPVVPNYRPSAVVIVLPVVRVDRGPDDDKPRRGARRRRLTKEGIWHG